MDNEAPKYASWVPQAGGYVANGKVVSKSPIYDEAGKLKLDVDTSVFGTTQPQNSVATPKVKPTNSAIPNLVTGITTAGMTTANTEGSGTDSNSLMTGAGSLGSLNNNTENTAFGPTNTPATKSNIAKEPILSPVDEVMRELQESIARGNDYQQQINLYTKLQNLTGEDYSAEIQSLTKQRQQKIENIDNNYSSQISTAMMRGDADEAARLRNEQSNWRNSVGYQDAMAQKFQTAREEINAEYVPTFWAGIQDIAGQIMQALPGVLNFQYNPYTDPALQMAQGYATSRVKEQMNSTGMYYSSMTQNAITKAVAELVPVYEKMAKEEAIQNFQLLQQTANFLVDLEQTQFNMWKGQLDMKFQANADKRAEVAAAWDKVNQLGYVDNETSAILGIPAGMESYATRKAYVDKLNEIDKERRKLDQDKALAEYENDLAIQKLERQSELDMDEYRLKASIDYTNDINKMREQNRLSKELYSFQQKNKASTGSGNGGIEVTRTIDNGDGTKTTYKETVYPDGKGGYVDANGNPVNLANPGTPPLDDKALETKLATAITDKNLGSAVRIMSDSKDKTLTDKYNVSNRTLKEILIPKIDEYADNFKDKDYNATKGAVDSALSDINTFVQGLEETGLSEANKKKFALEAYQRLFSDINTSSGFDWSYFNLADNPDELRLKAKQDIVEDLEKNGKTEYVRTYVVQNLSAQAQPQEKAQTPAEEREANTQKAITTLLKTDPMTGLKTGAAYVASKLTSPTYPLYIK